MTVEGNATFEQTVENIAISWEAPPDVMRDWFSGDDPEAGAVYAFKVKSVFINTEGRVVVSMNFVKQP